MCHVANSMIVRVTVDIDVPDDNPRFKGEGEALLARDGDRAKYFKAIVTRSSTEDDSLRFMKIESR